MNHRVATPSPSRHGFTLVELLIVIGIIAVLISILLPAVGKVRVAAQKVATQNTINRLVNGCEQYFQDYGAYPGPFDDGQLAPNSTVAPVLVIGTTSYTLQDETNAQFTKAPTSSENLFLGLCGGLRLEITTGPGGTKFVYDNPVAKRGIGPRGLGTGIAKKSLSYFEIGDGDISAGDDMRNPLTDSMVPASLWWGGAPGPALTAPFVGDTAIFEFMDRFSRPKPILYLRAVRGTSRIAPGDLKGFIFDPYNGTPGNTRPFQYDPTLIQRTYSNIGLQRDKITTRTGKEWTADTIDYPNMPVDPANPATGTNIKFKEGNERYFVNEQISTGNPVTTGVANNILIPQHKDGFMLISAGADGLYGTADDIRN